MKNQVLCYRCEFRAQFLETGSAPRNECKEPLTANYICYMYKPVLPVTLQRAGNDPRGEYGGIFGARQEAIGLAEMDLEVKELKEAISYAYYVPKEVKE